MISPLISIVIPTYKRNETLLQCLEHLNEAFKQVPTGAAEVIVSDDYNADETRDFLSGRQFVFDLKLVGGPRKGPAANRNNGAKNAVGDWLMFTDDDCLPDKGIIKNYLAAIAENKDFVVFEGKIISDRERKRYDEEAPINLTGNNFWSCNICLKKSLYMEVGGFDEKFPYPYMEDIDLFVRLKRKTDKIKFVEQAFVVHPWRPKRGWSGYLKSTDSILYFNEKNRDILKLSKWMYFKILIGGFSSRLKTLAKFKFRGLKDFAYENVFYLVLAFKFYKKFAKASA